VVETSSPSDVIQLLSAITLPFPIAHLALMLAGLGITTRASQILLTQGTSQALELVIRYLLRPGDKVLVDDPGYYNMFGSR
jgi:DNA-binding transcriptional MocR family regulator